MPSQIQNPAEPSQDVSDSSTIPPPSPPSTTTSPVALGQTLASSAVTITTFGTVSSSKPSVIVTNGTAIPSATRALTVDAVVVASQSLSPGAPSGTNPLNVLPSAPTSAGAYANNTITSSSPPSTTTTPMLPSQILPSGLPALTLSAARYYSNSSYAITTTYSTPVTLATGSVNDVGGVTTSAFGGVAAPTQAKGAGGGGASGGATPVDTSGAGTHRVGVGMGFCLVLGIYGVVFGSLGAL